MMDKKTIRVIFLKKTNDHGFLEEREIPEHEALALIYKGEARKALTLNDADKCVIK